MYDLFVNIILVDLVWGTATQHNRGGGWGGRAARLRGLHRQLWLVAEGLQEAGAAKRPKGAPDLAHVLEEPYYGSPYGLMSGMVWCWGY
jgi:hypothetical protein